MSDAHRLARDPPLTGATDPGLSHSHPCQPGRCRPPRYSNYELDAADARARAPRTCRPARTSLGPAAAGAAWPLQTSAAKSRTGHAEPAAGAVGVAALASSLPLAMSSPMCHLRQVRQALPPCFYKSRMKTIEASGPVGDYA